MTGHEYEELAKMIAERECVDIAKMEWTEHGLLVVYRANGLVPMFCGETVTDAPLRRNVQALTACAIRAKEAAKERDNAS